MKKAIVLLSGGMDSAVVLAIARHSFECIALSFDYGQKHAREELAAAAHLARDLEHVVLQLPLSSWTSGSSLTNESTPVPLARTETRPSTYVPARNTVFLSLALSLAEARSAEAIFIGANALDYQGYPDCRPEYFKAFSDLALVGTRAAKISIEAPLLFLSKKEIAKKGLALSVDFAVTHSCYSPLFGVPCAQCDACVLRQEAFL